VVAQWLEHSADNRKVGSSNLPRSTETNGDLMLGWMIAGYLLLTQGNRSVNMSLPLCESQRYFDRMLLQNAFLSPWCNGNTEDSRPSDQGSIP
jgi:hypothetical protein